MGYRVNGRVLLRERTLASQRGGELREESGVACLCSGAVTRVRL